MDKNNLLMFYKFEHIKHSVIHSAGSDLFFYRPCIGYIKKGYAKFLYKGKTLYAHQGDLIYIGFETRYQSIWFGSPDIEWYSINFEFGSKYHLYDYRFQILKDYPSDVFEKMYQTYNDSPMLSISYFYKLLDDIYKKLKTTAIPTHYHTIEPAIEHIEKKYSEPLSINELANLCNLSESGFFKLFKNATGVTPITYKHNIMIQKAIELISNTTLSIEEISTKVGFGSSNYFRKVFFQMTDKKPKELRKNS